MSRKSDLGYPGAPNTGDDSGRVAPWGVRRMRPFQVPMTYSPQPVVARIELDPVTQAAIAYDEFGAIITMDRHRKTYQGTEKSVPTGTTGDGQRANPDDQHTQTQDEQD